jgi:tetratricopeptide (TPR) repeat protein
MINLALSLAAGIATAVAVRLAGFSLIAGIVPGTVVFLGVMIALGRRSFTQVQKVMAQVQAELSSIGGNQKEAKVKADKAIKLLEGALPIGKWQFLIESQIWGQIGTIKYLFKDLDGALEAFGKAGSRDMWAQALTAAIRYQRKDFSAMESSFEAAVTAGKKEGVVWAAYAWCLAQQKEGDKALRVLARAVEANPNDEKLKKALTDLQNDKRLKMKAWEPMWWQFGLEAPPMPQAQFVGGGRRMRGMRR